MIDRLIEAIKRGDAVRVGEIQSKITGKPFTPDDRSKVMKAEEISINIEEAEKGGEKNKG